MNLIMNNRNKKLIHKFYFLSLFILSFTFISCDALFSSSSSSTEESVELTKKQILNRCIKHNFEQGQDTQLYGLECIEGKKLLIKTTEGTLVPTTTANNKLKLEVLDPDGRTKDVESIPNLINKFYKVEYTIQKNQGDDKKIPWLRNLLPLHEKDIEFYGYQNQNYHIVFKTLGNYLILYKASQDINDIPYTERTAIPKTNNSNGDYIKSKEGYYMAPFLGYKIEYCRAKIILDDTDHSQTHLDRCEPVNNKGDKPDYIKLQTSSKITYDLGKEHYALKKDVFPASYFDGTWFYSKGEIESANTEAHRYAQGARLVQLNRTDKALILQVVSGKASQRTQTNEKLFSIKWKEYKPIKERVPLGDFKEKEDITSSSNQTDRPYIEIQFLKIGEQMEKLIITENYFSFVKSYLKEEHRIKEKISLLRKSTLDQEGFLQKRWFKDDQEHRFGMMPVSPEREIEPGPQNDEKNTSHIRLIKFNTSQKNTTIKWHFSDYIVDGDDEVFYRKIGREALEIWNRTFQILTEDDCKNRNQKKDCKTIKVVLAENEGNKDLGDLRYNILNLVKVNILDDSKNDLLLGQAPSFAQEDTGQILGTTSNIFIHSLVGIYKTYVNQYIRYEIFRKDNNTICEKNKNQAEKDKEIHALSPYIRSQIEKQCDEVISFICNKKAENTKLKPRDNLEDSEIISSCGKKISREYILRTILHEMGHNFGLGHNFRASTDKDNYYQSLEEMKEYFPMAKASELPKTSSVMDYTPPYAPPLTVPGKYDLATLRYLYLDQVETKTGGFLTLNTPENPEEQQPLSEDTLSQMKNYASCWDTVKNEVFHLKKTKEGYPLKSTPFMMNTEAEDFLCLTHDYGSNPKEIVQNDINHFKRSLLSYRYSYDNSTDPGFTFLHRRILGFYNKWIQLRNQYLKSISQTEKAFSLFDDKESSLEYQKVIQEGLLCGEEKLQKGECQRSEEYDLYYDIRDVVFHFLMEDILFLKTMKCKVQDPEGRSRQLDLEAIKGKLSHGNKLYVEDCESEQIQDFFRKNDLTYLGQTGLENFSSYYSQGLDDDKEDLFSLSQFFGILKINLLVLNKFNHLVLKYRGLTPSIKPISIKPISLTGFLEEPDFLQNFLDRLKEDLLSGKEKGASKNDLTNISQNIQKIFSFLSINKDYAPDKKTKNIITKNHKYFERRIMNTGNRVDSFYREFIEPIEKGMKPYLVFENYPFLMEAYTDYLKTQNSQERQETPTFQKYLLGRNDVLDDTIDGVFHIPLVPENLIVQIFEKYNEYLSELTKFDEKERRGENLTVLDQMEKEAIERTNVVLFRK